MAICAMTASKPVLRRALGVGAACGLALAVLAPAAAGAQVADKGAIVLPALAFPPSPPNLSERTDEADISADQPLSAAAICGMIARNADAVGMSPDFFARLIWKESRFDAGAVSPVGARGIAQFMPYTAKERGLDDPYDARQALRHSALYLADLRAELGNWGLAAAAYNGGINRVKRWLVSGGSLPYETEDYVNAITFRPADWFREDGRELEPRPLDADRDFDESCARLPIMKTRAVFAAFDAVESAPMRPWGVQVAGHARQAVAMKMFRRVQSRFGAILKGRDPLVIRGRNGARQRIYAVRIGADTRGEADALCGRLRGAGGSCVVLKN